MKYQKTMGEITYKKAILEELEKEKKRIRRILTDNSSDFEELQSDLQEPDSPAERNLLEVEWSQYEALQQELVEISDAKNRLNEDTYGICEDCGEEISEKRLKRVLTAKRCILCQEKFEKEAALHGRKVVYKISDGGKKALKILIATGGSDYSYMAVEKACEMVIKPESSEIRIISVYNNLAEMSAEPLEISADQIQELENIGKLQSMEYALKAEDIIKDHFPEQKINISMNAVRGSAKDLILEEATKWKADLIIVGSLGHNFLSRFFLGSVSDAIVRHAKCSVLVVRGDLEQD